MTSASLNGLRTGTTGGDLPDERMDQIRDLLIGDYVRQFDNRLSELENRVRDIEADVASRIDALNMRLEALAGETTGDRRAAFDELSKGLTELSDRVSRLSKM